MKNHISGVFQRLILILPDIFLNKHRMVPFLILSTISCSDFVEVDPPKNILVSETVFNDPSTVESALANIFYKMRGQGIVTFRLSADMGIYADELDYYRTDPDYTSLYLHNLLPVNGVVSDYWNNTYNIIYAANDIIEGVERTTALTDEEKEEFKGQALFIRAYMHSLLANLFGDVPYISSTDYLDNNKVARMPLSEVYAYIVDDLTTAVSLLGMADLTGEKVIPNRSAANALLARTYLYLENWELAEITSSKLIDNFNLEPDLDKVFLKESKETIWQFRSDDDLNRNTFEANQFIILAIPGQEYALTNFLLESFENEDLRLKNWIGSFTANDGSTKLYFANKYKAILSETESLEYSIVLRLAEQYLIRAEARAHLGNIPGSQNDINVIRDRAGLAGTTAGTKDDLLDTILMERFVELFTEQGHRWFDLKRTGKAGTILGPIKGNWNPTDLVWPIPERELEYNLNLRPQNPGY